jgi:hypothetical protein
MKTFFSRILSSWNTILVRYAILERWVEYDFHFDPVRNEVEKKPVFPKGKQAAMRTFDLESVSARYI